MGPRAAVASLLACGVQLTVARFAHDPDGKKAHSHKFLSFCGDDGTAGGMYTISCEFNAQTNWPDMVDAFTYLTYPVCSKGMPASFDTGVSASFTACADMDMVSQTANNKGDVTRDPMKFPLKSTDPTGMDVYQPVIVPVGEPETNPHHLVWPEGRQPSVAQLAATLPEADGAAREKIKLLRNLAIMHGTGSGDAELKKLHMKMDAHTLNIWDRIQIRDGQLMSTITHTKYTDAMCARLCTKMQGFRGNDCIAYSRKWFKTDIDEHLDTCGRDGDVGISRQATTTTGWGQNYNTDREYKYPGQCVFYGKMFDDGSTTTLGVTNLCTTAEDWLLDKTGVPYPLLSPGPTAAELKTCTEEGAAGTGTSCVHKDSCQYRHGYAKTNWKDKTRSWRMLTATGGLAKSGYDTPSASDPQEGMKAAGLMTDGTGAACCGAGRWPAQTPATPIQEGRRLMAESNYTRDGHEFILPNGTHFWAWE